MQHRGAGSEKGSGSFPRALPGLGGWGLSNPWLAQDSGGTEPGSKLCPGVGEGIAQPARLLGLVVMKKKGTGCLGFSVEGVFHPDLLIQGIHMTWEVTLPPNLHLLTLFFSPGQDYIG